MAFGRQVVSFADGARDLINNLAEFGSGFEGGTMQDARLEVPGGVVAGVGNSPGDRIPTANMNIKPLVVLGIAAVVIASL